MESKHNLSLITVLEFYISLYGGWNRVVAYRNRLESIPGLLKSLQIPALPFFIISSESEPEFVNFMGAPKSIPRNRFLGSLKVQKFGQSCCSNAAFSLVRDQLFPYLTSEVHVHTWPLHSSVGEILHGVPQLKNYRFTVNCDLRDRRKLKIV